MITVTQRIWRDSFGKPTIDPEKAVSTLHLEGSEVTEEQAKGLPKEAIESKAVKQATADKAMKSAPENKSHK